MPTSVPSGPTAAPQPVQQPVPQAVAQPRGEASPARTVVHVMRHGQVHNPEGLLYGRLPGYHLSELGHEMARVVAESLAGNDITHVVASPLERAQETAAPIAAAHGLQVLTDERVIESENHFEGKRVSPGDGAWSDPRHWHRLVDPFTPSWGEPYERIAARMVAAVREARDAARGHEAVIVSHQLPVWTLRRWVERRRLWHDPRRRECGLASLTSLVFDGDELGGLRYSEPAGHLVPESKRNAPVAGV